MIVQDLIEALEKIEDKYKSVTLADYSEIVVKEIESAVFITDEE